MPFKRLHATSPKGRKNTLHLVTRSFLTTLPRNSYFLLHHTGFVRIRFCTANFFFFDECDCPADRKSCNGWNAKPQRAAPEKTLTSKQEAERYVFGRDTGCVTLDKTKSMMDTVSLAVQKQQNDLVFLLFPDYKPVRIQKS